MNYLSFETIIFKKMYTLKGFLKVLFSNIHSLHLQNKCITKQTFQLISHINCSKRKLMLTCPLSIPRSHAEIDHTLPLSEGVSPIFSKFQMGYAVKIKSVTTISL